MVVRLWVEMLLGFSGCSFLLGLVLMGLLLPPSWAHFTMLGLDQLQPKALDDPINSKDLVIFQWRSLCRKLNFLGE
jgi:hypothetical protein